MGISEKITCDGCGEECFYYMSIDKMKVRAANGKTMNKVFGYADIECGPIVICSLDCFYPYFNKALNRGRYISNDMYIPGEQVEVQSAGNGKPVGK